MALSLPAMVGLAAGAVADEAWKADPPGHWRKLTWDENTTTSKCIGKPISPICAVETIFACFIYGKEELCHAAIFRQDDRKVFPSDPAYWIYFAYRISAVKKIKAGEHVTLLGERAKPGDYLVDQRYHLCRTETNHCENDIGPATTHLVRKIGDEWRIITWDTPRW